MRICERQAQVYCLPESPKAPIYRVPLYGTREMPALLSDGRLTDAQAVALAQFYVDAQGFNASMDLVTSLPHGAAEREIRRTMLKATHLTKGVPDSRFDQAIQALRLAGLPERMLQQFPVDVARELGPGDASTGS